MKVGVVSFAHMHAWGYAEALQQMENVQLAGIYDDNAERGEEAAAKLGSVFYHELEQLLQTDIAAVIVTSENVKHCGHVLAAAAAGKHVLCEKPLSTDIESGQIMIDACKRNNVMLGTAFPVRFSTSVERAKQLVDQGAIGKILAIKGTNRGTNPGGWFVDPALSGGGALMDHTVHVVDLMRWFLKSEVKDVYAEADRLISEYPTDDCGVLSLEFENGVFATLDFSWSRNKTYPTWGDVTMELLGTEGTLSVDATAQKLHVYSNRSGYKWAPWGDNMDFGLIANFIGAVREGKQPLVTGEDGLRAIEVVMGGYESASIHKKVVLHS